MRISSPQPWSSWSEGGCACVHARGVHAQDVIRRRWAARRAAQTAARVERVEHAVGQLSERWPEAALHVWEARPGSWWQRTQLRVGWLDGPRGSEVAAALRGAGVRGVDIVRVLSLAGAVAHLLDAPGTGAEFLVMERSDDLDRRERRRAQAEAAVAPATLARASELVEIARGVDEWGSRALPARPAGVAAWDVDVQARWWLLREGLEVAVALTTEVG